MFDYSDDEVRNGCIRDRSHRNSRRDLDYPGKSEIENRYPSLEDSKRRSRLFQSSFPVLSQYKVNPVHQMKEKNGIKNTRVFGIEAEHDHPDSFFRSMQVPVLMAQIFSLLPMTGYGGPNYKSIKFQWMHWKMVYFAVVLAGIVFLFLCVLVQNLEQGLSYDKSSGFVFYGTGIAASFLLLELSKKWRLMSGDFAEMEWKLRKYSYPKGLTRRYKMVTVIFMLIALVEHLLSRVAEMIRTTPCSKDDRLSSVVESFLVNYYHEIFSFTEYAMWKGVVFVVLHFFCTFTWNFSDLVLALISWTIAMRFRLFNQALFKVQGQEKDFSFWKATREDYNELTLLTKKVDSHIQKLMLLSLGDNLYFICIQLLKGLKKSGNFYETLYFLWSVGFLIGRTCFVAFTAAGINDESKEAKSVLYSVPEESYSTETRRFLTQLSTNDVALTGCRFFSITRGFILTIAGTVVTYEVILVQFNTGDESWSNSNKTDCFFI